jgi:hypothetical protein
LSYIFLLFSNLLMSSVWILTKASIYITFPLIYHLLSSLNERTGSTVISWEWIPRRILSYLLYYRNRPLSSCFLILLLHAFILWINLLPLQSCGWLIPMISSHYRVEVIVIRKLRDREIYIYIYSISCTIYLYAFSLIREEIH